MSKEGYDAELNDLVRSKTEIQCIIEDLAAAGERGQERKGALERDLASVMARIQQIEVELMELDPELNERAREEKEEKRRYAIYYT